MESLLKNKARSLPLTSEQVNILSGKIFPWLYLQKTWYRVTHWETWDWRIKYILIGPAWLWFCLRARSLWFFTASNPTLTFGGFDGESKKEMYDQLPPGTYPKSIYVSPDISLEHLELLLTEHKYAFPFAVKPNVGKMGFMFRRINSFEELKAYHSRIHCEYIIQEFVQHPIEVSVFYYRLPHAQTGTITGFLRKDYLEVTGDGKSDLRQLICTSPHVQFRREEMMAKHRSRLDHIPLEGERYCLSPALNLSRGGKLVSLEAEKDDRLLKVFDALSHYTGNFYYGRYDIKCRSIEDLKDGTNFSILEYNGSGAEPHHVYGNGYGLWQACRILVSHWEILYRISQINRARGMACWNFRRGTEFMNQTAKHLKKLRQLDLETPLT